MKWSTLLMFAVIGSSSVIASVVPIVFSSHYTLKDYDPTKESNNTDLDIYMPPNSRPKRFANALVWLSRGVFMVHATSMALAVTCISMSIISTQNCGAPIYGYDICGKRKKLGITATNLEAKANQSTILETALYNDANRLETLYLKAELFSQSLERFAQYIYDINSNLHFLSVQYESEKYSPSDEERAGVKLQATTTVKFAAGAKDLSKAFEKYEGLDGATVGVQLGGTFLWFLCGILPRVYTNLHGLTSGAMKSDYVVIGTAGNKGGWQLASHGKSGQLFLVRPRATSQIFSSNTYKHAIKFGYDSNSNMLKNMWRTASMNKGERIQLMQFMEQNGKFKNFLDFLVTKGDKGQAMIKEFKSLSPKHQQAILDNIKKVGGDPKLTYKYFKHRGGLAQVANQKVQFRAARNEIIARKSGTPPGWKADLKSWTVRKWSKVVNIAKHSFSGGPKPVPVQNLVPVAPPPPGPAGELGKNLGPKPMSTLKRHWTNTKATIKSGYKKVSKFGSGLFSTLGFAFSAANIVMCSKQIHNSRVGTRDYSDQLDEAIGKVATELTRVDGYNKNITSLHNKIKNNFKTLLAPELVNIGKLLHKEETSWSGLPLAADGCDHLECQEGEEDVEDFDVATDQDNGEVKVGKDCSMNKAICREGQKIVNGLIDASENVQSKRTVYDEKYRQTMAKFDQLSAAFPSSQLMEDMMNGARKMDLATLSKSITAADDKLRELNDQMAQYAESLEGTIMVEVSLTQVPRPSVKQLMFMSNLPLLDVLKIAAKRLPSVSHLEGYPLKCIRTGAISTQLALDEKLKYKSGLEIDIKNFIKTITRFVSSTADILTYVKSDFNTRKSIKGLDEAAILKVLANEIYPLKETLTLGSKTYILGSVRTQIDC